MNYNQFTLTMFSVLPTYRSWQDVNIICANSFLHLCMVKQTKFLASCITHEKPSNIQGILLLFMCFFTLRLFASPWVYWHGKFKAARWATVVSMMVSLRNCQLEVAVSATTSKDIYPFWPMIARPFHYVTSTSCASTWLIQLFIHGKWLSLQRERRPYLVAFQ
jgi:hypothetical protein